MDFSLNTCTHDAFLGGQLTISQPVNGYRAGVDPVFLAAAVPARPGQSVLELGCGAGTAALCLGTRVNGMRLVGVERHPLYAELARHNAQQNQIPFDIFCADIDQMPSCVRQDTFDHVILNPPYFLRDRGTASPDALREGALGEDTPLNTWIDIATRRLSPKGYLTLIQQAERLPSILNAIDDRLGSVCVKPLCPRVGRAASLVIVQARKSAHGAFRLLAPAILHASPHHDVDRNDYTSEIEAVLRQGKSLTLY